MDNCLNCKKFKPSLEAGAELTPDSAKLAKGKCGENNKACTAQDTCGCGGFINK